MAKLAAKQKQSDAGRGGRPPRERAGEVEERILDAAHRLFVERGLAGTSIDEIASQARAGKPTIYARYPGKEALFAAVVMRQVAETLARFEDHVPPGSTLDERLTNLAAGILHWALASDTVDLMRLGISEARRFPDLSLDVHLAARRRGEETVAKLLAEAAAEADDCLPAFAPERLATTTKFFMDLVFLPIILRALFGEKREVLREEIELHVARSVAFFLAACRNGSVS